MKLRLRDGLGELRFGPGGAFGLQKEGCGNLAGRAKDGLSVATSCNTDYKINKRYLTTLRERPNASKFDQSTVYSTVKDALSIATGR